jgi:hypothetical protein
MVTSMGLDILVACLITLRHSHPRINIFLHLHVISAVGSIIPLVFKLDTIDVLHVISLLVQRFLAIYAENKPVYASFPGGELH